MISISITLQELIIFLIICLPFYIWYLITRGDLWWFFRRNKKFTNWMYMLYLQIIGYEKHIIGDDIAFMKNGDIHVIYGGESFYVNPKMSKIIKGKLYHYYGIDFYGIDLECKFYKLIKRSVIIKKVLG